MSISYHVIGIKPPDEKWKRMKAVYDACMEADTSIPDEVTDFFEDQIPDDNGVVVHLANDYKDTERHQSVKQISKPGLAGFNIDIAKLSKDVSIIRFEISW